MYSKFGLKIGIITKNYVPHLVKWSKWIPKFLIVPWYFNDLNYSVPFGLQRPTVTLWKDLKAPKNILLTHKTGRVFKINFALSI